MENYKEKYEKALARARNLHKDAIDMENNLCVKQCEIIFPELAESEDERVRKAILAIISNYVDNSNTFKSKMLAWLEKQNNPKPELLPDEDEIYWLAWVIGRLPDTEKANEAEAVLIELLKKLENMKGCE